MRDFFYGYPVSLRPIDKQYGSDDLLLCKINNYFLHIQNIPSQIGIITDIPYALINSKKRAEYQGQHYNVKHVIIPVLTDGIFF